MGDQPNAALARHVWEALSRGDAESLREFLAPDAVWHATALGTPWSGAHRGREAILDFLADVGERTEEFDAKWVDVLTSEERVLVIYHVALGLGARRTQVDYLLLGRVEAGRFAEIWTLPLDPAAIEGFWARRKP
jgi:ketosteroid isomerase-like protein